MPGAELSWRGIGDGVQSLALPRLQEGFEWMFPVKSKSDPSSRRGLVEDQPWQMRPERAVLPASLEPPRAWPSGASYGLSTSVGPSPTQTNSNLHPGDTSLHSPPEH